MASKQPLYTVIGWAVWKAGKLYLRRRVKAALPSRTFLAVGAVGVIAAGVAAGAASNASGND